MDENDTLNSVSMYDTYASISFWSSMAMIATGIGVFVFAIAAKVYGAGYGRHYQDKKDVTSSGFNRNLSDFGPNLNAKLAWFLQEICSILAVLAVILVQVYLLAPENDGKNCWSCVNPNVYICILPYALHYFHRSIIYPLCIKTKNPVSLSICASAGIFCLWNGATQMLGCFGKYGGPLQVDNGPCYYGLILFFFGMGVNMWSDYHLIALKKQNQGYQVPSALPFRLVSSPNYLGEILEWTGYCIFNFQWSTVAFVVFTIANLGPRAIKNHNWYVEKFGSEYPRSRKVIIPYVY